MDDKPFIIEIPRLLGNKIYKKLTFAVDEFTVEKLLSFDPIIRIPAKNIGEFRYGVNWISGYKFVFGRQYIVEICGDDGKTFQIKLTSLYGLKKKIYLDIWSEILEQLWHYYFRDIYTDFFNQYKNKERFDLAGVEFHPFGIRWNNKGLFWDEIALSSYKTYFVIHHKDDAKNNHSRNFKNDWNAYLLQKLLKGIIEEFDQLKV